MQDLFATPGMIALSALVLGFNVISLVVMVIFVIEYRHLYTKRKNILIALDAEHTFRQTSEGRLIVIAYIAGTTCIAFVTLFLFVVQPHWL